ncbi:hypothetical protein CDL12_05084 [Handroanthus impetiginosus]|uniref:Uncharacterized protein n=1 Tax=Handroanthus impetiginosus TaxID=429701 RepID=A0A2G9HXJ7_9LAMI|nr:hypothetical protein CDL12_05084 [Handroanthus impetiginosus]
MASTLTAPKSPNLPHLIGKNYEISLKQSIEALLTSPENSNSGNTTNFISEFQEFVQSKADPPLESIWIYTALAFTRSSTPNTEPFSRISAIKDLFQLIVSCSASCNSIKSIALAAPVIYSLHNFILDVKSFQLGSKKERKVNGEIKSLVDTVLGYISVCCNSFDGNFDESEGLIRPLGDLVSFWLVDNGVRNQNVESVRAFFPLLSDDIVTRVSAEGCGIVELAGFVVTEAFLLKLCWRIREEGFGEKMQNELRSWVVGSMTGLRSSYFYGTLVLMLLEPVLPITSLLNLEHEAGLRKVLLDAFILVEYSFLTPQSLVQLPVKHAKRVVFTKLVATHQAIELFRKHGDQSKAIYYLKAFANSSLPSLIVNWIRSEIGTETSISEPTGSSPGAFIRWMLNIENRGIKIFDNDMSKFRTAFNSKEESEQLVYGEEKKKPEPDIPFYIDKKGQENYTDDEDEKMSAAFMDAAHSMQAGRKRRTKDGEKRKHVKFVKHNVFNHSSLGGERSADPRNDHSDSGSDVENPSSDEDMEI